VCVVAKSLSLPKHKNDESAFPKQGQHKLSFSLYLCKFVENYYTEIPYGKSTITKLAMLPDSSTSSSSLKLLSKIQAPLCLSFPAPALGLAQD